MLNFIANFCGNENGGTAIEYGLIAALLVIAMMTGLNSVATSTQNMWIRVTDTSADAMKDAR